MSSQEENLGRSSSSSPFFNLSRSPLDRDTAFQETDIQESISPTFRQPSLQRQTRLDNYGLRKIPQEVKSEEEQDDDQEVSLQGRLTFPMRLPARSFTANYQNDENTATTTTINNTNAMRFISPQIQKYALHDEFKNELFGEQNQENIGDNNNGMINSRQSVTPKPFNGINHQKNFSFRESAGFNNEADGFVFGQNNSKFNRLKNNNQLSQSKENYESEYGKQQQYAQDSQIYYYKPTESFESPVPLSFSNEKEQAVINRINDFQMNSPSEIRKKFVHDQVEKLCDKNEDELNWVTEIQLGQQKTLIASNDLCQSQQKEIKELRNKLRIFTEIIEKIHKINKKKKDKKQLNIPQNLTVKQSESEGKEAKLFKTQPIQGQSIEIAYSQQLEMQTVSVQTETQGQDNSLQLDEVEDQRQINKGAPTDKDKEEEYNQTIIELSAELGQVYATMFAQDQEFKTKIEIKETEIQQLKTKLQTIEIEGIKKAEQIRSLLDQINKEQTHICVFQDITSNHINNNNMNLNIQNSCNSFNLNNNNNTNTNLNLKNISNSNTNNNIISYDEADDEEDDEDNNNNNQLHAHRNRSNYRSQRNSMKNSRGSGFLQSTKNNSQHSLKNLIVEQQEEIVFEQEEQFQEQQQKQLKQQDEQNMHIQHYSPCSQEIYTSSSQEESRQTSQNNVAEKAETFQDQGYVQVDERREGQQQQGDFEDACDRISERLELQPSQSGSQQLEQQGVDEQQRDVQGQNYEQGNYDNQGQRDENYISQFAIAMDDLLQGVQNQSQQLGVAPLEIPQQEQGYSQDQFMVVRVIFDQLDCNNKQIMCLYDKISQYEQFLQQEQEKQLEDKQQQGEIENRDEIQEQNDQNQDEKYQQFEDISNNPQQLQESWNILDQPQEIEINEIQKKESIDVDLKINNNETQSSVEKNEVSQQNDNQKIFSTEQQVKHQEEIKQTEKEQIQQQENNIISLQSQVIDRMKDQEQQTEDLQLQLDSLRDDQKQQEEIMIKKNDTATQTSDEQKDNDKDLILQLQEQIENFQKVINEQLNQIGLLKEQISKNLEDTQKFQIELEAGRLRIDENKKIIKNQQQVIEQLQKELSKLSEDNQNGHEKEQLMMEVISGKMHLQFENNHSTWTKEELEEIIIHEKKKKSDNQKKKEKEEEKQAQKIIQLEQSQYSQTDEYVSSEYQNLLEEYQKQQQQLDSSQGTIVVISQQLSSVSAELAQERALRIARDLELQKYFKQVESQDNGVQVRVTDALIKNRNDLAKEIFESISYFLRELHGHIQNHQTSFLKKIYIQAYEKLQNETEDFNKETEITFNNMNSAVNPLEYLPEFYQPVKTHMHETLLQLLDVLSQILKNQNDFNY